MPYGYSEKNTTQTTKEKLLAKRRKTDEKAESVRDYGYYSKKATQIKKERLVERKKANTSSYKGSERAKSKFHDGSPESQKKAFKFNVENGNHGLVYDERSVKKTLEDAFRKKGK